MRKARTAALGFVLSGVFLWLALRKVRFDELAVALRAVSPLPVLAGVGLFLLSLVVRARLWGVLMGGGARAPQGRLLVHLLVGLMTNNVLPARAGEVVRAYGAAKDTGMPRTVVFSTIVVERLLDLVWLLAFVSLLLVSGNGSGWLVGAARIALAGLAGTVAAGVLVVWRGAWFTALLAGLVPARWRPAARRQIDYYAQALSEGARLAARPGAAAKAVGLSLGAWILWVGFLALVLAGFGIQTGVLEAFELTGIVNLGALVPSAPGYVGTFQFACVKGFELLGLDPSRGMAVSLVLHASWYVPTTVLGLVAAWRTARGGAWPVPSSHR